MSDTEARKDEILALTSIFDKNVFKPETDGGGEIFIQCQLPDDFHLHLRNEEYKLACEAGARVEEKDGKVLIPISFLPPLELRFTYPEDYPSCSAPDFSLSCKWLSQKQINVICHSLDGIWEDNKGEVILFLWADYLQNVALYDLGITSGFMIEYDGDEPTRDCRPLCDVGGLQVTEMKASCRGQTTHASSPEFTIREIVTFDLARKAEAFSASVISCGICYCDAQGSDCVSFIPCQHAYCKDCITEHFSINIAEGRVLGLCCPETDCESKATPRQVKDLVDNSLFERYDNLLLQTSLDKMDDIFYCPRPGCGAAVIKDKTGHLATCSICRFVFCTLCGKTNHGVFDCQQAKREKIEMMKRMKLEEARRTEEEADELLQRELEEVAGEQYLLKFSKMCPGCSFRVQKLSGCNKMTCVRCLQCFCWVCLKPLNKYKPYEHFEDPNSDCYHLLHTDFEDEEH